MNGFTFLDAKPVEKKEGFRGLTFATGGSTVPAPSRTTRIVKRPIGAQIGAVGLRYSPDGNSEDDDDQQLMQSQDEDGDDESDDYDNFQNSRGTKRGRSTSSSVNGNPNKVRITGGRPAVHKTVTVNLDSDDEIIVSMKDQGIKDEVIRDRLIAEGRVRYDPKTISTRFVRLKKCLEKHEEEQMEDNFSDFHEDEDLALQQCHHETEAWFQKGLADLQNKRYREISTLMRRRIGKGKYSRRACIDRLQDLADGTAVVPIEQDPDATTRRAKTMEMIEQRRNERRVNAQNALEEIEKKLKAKEDADRAKAEARAKAERERSEKAAAIEALRLKRELRKQELLEIKEAKEAKKNKTQAQKEAEAKEKVRLKEEEKAAKIEERRAAREKAKLDLETRRMQKALADHEAKVKMIRTKAIALEIVKKQMLEIVAPNVVRRASAPSKKAVAKAAAPKKTPVKAAATPKKTIVKKVATPKARATPKSAIKKTHATKKSPARAKGKGKVIDSADANNIGSPTHTPNGHATDNETDEIISIPVSGITSNNFTISMTSSSVDSPRKIMPITALKDLCLKRELKMKPGANKDDLLKQLKSDDLNKGHEVLKDICRKRKLIIGGSKPVMAERIANDDAAIWQRKNGVESGAKKSESARKKVTFIGVVSDSDGANGTTTQGSSRDAVIVIDDETTTPAAVNSATNNEDMDVDDSKAINEHATDALIDDTVVNSLATNADNDTTPAMAEAAASKHGLISGSINTHPIIDDNASTGASANDAGESHDEDVTEESVKKTGNSTADDNVEMTV